MLIIDKVKMLASVTYCPLNYFRRKQHKICCRKMPQIGKNLTQVKSLTSNFCLLKSDF